MNGIGAPNSALGAFLIRRLGQKLIQSCLWGRAQGRVGRSDTVAFIGLRPLFFGALSLLASAATRFMGVLLHVGFKPRLEGGFRFVDGLIKRTSFGSEGGFGCCHRFFLL